MHHPSDYQGGPFPDDMPDTWHARACSAAIILFGVAYAIGRLAWRAVPDGRSLAHATFRASIGSAFLIGAELFGSEILHFAGKTGLVLAVYGLVSHSEGIVANAVMDRCGIKRAEQIGGDRK